jgi:hypothetical protein
MCLISKWKFPKKAKEDIICYKILTRSNGIYKTPITYTSVDINRPLIAKGNSFRIVNPDIKDIGYIHTLMFVNDGKEIMKRDGYTKATKASLWKCIIPKGTKYHISKIRYEYCSKQIIFI